jgi:hypothetical protein
MLLGTTPKAAPPSDFQFSAITGVIFMIINWV